MTREEQEHYEKLAEHYNAKQKSKTDRLYSWLNDMRLGIAPDETTPQGERAERLAQIDVIDGIMEWLEKNKQEPKTEWIPATTPPTRSDRYLVTRECLGKTFVDIVSYATNLYEVNKYEFYDKKNKCGWWKSDSECGSYEINGIAGWQELPESYKESEE